MLVLPFGSSPMMRVLFRADASVEIGAGHVMRCLALAEVLRNRGAIVHFVSRAAAGDLHDLVKARGYCVHPLPPVDTVHDEGKDASDALAIVSGLESFDVAIVDHYGLSEQWERAVRPSVRHVVAIDDLPERRHAVDLLLDQNSRVPSSTDAVDRAHGTEIFLAGPAYALLRSEFRKAREDLSRRSGRLATVLIYYGASDSTDETTKVLNALLAAGDINYDIEVVVGGANVRREAIRTLCSSQPRISYRCQIDDMAQTMARADVAFGAAGVSAWERCCVGLPTLLTIQSVDQVTVARTLEAAGAGLNLGWHSDVKAADYVRAFSNLTPQGLAKMEDVCLALVDGQGAERVADAIFSLSQKPNR
jgi:UDP-2,4-diacetamido-2,4,6-trideoxy-beta-L-altropyranose hydrolase